MIYLRQDNYPVSSAQFSKDYATTEMSALGARVSYEG